MTGAPVPLFATQDVSVAAANIGIQVQSAALPNGSTAQCVTGFTFQPLSGASISIPCSAHPVSQVIIDSGQSSVVQAFKKKIIICIFKMGNGSPSTALIHYQQLQSGTTTSIQTGSVAAPGLQVVASQASSLAIHQQILLQSRQIRKCLFNEKRFFCLLSSL